MPADRTIAEDYAAPLVDLYSDLESNLAQEIARRLAKGLDSPAWAADKLAATGDLRRAAQAMVAQVQADSQGVIDRAIQQAYGQGSRVASAELSDVLGQGLTPAAARGVASALPGQRSIARMVSTLATKLKGTHVPLLRWVEDTYRQVVATTALHPVLAGTATRRQAAERTWQTFLGKGVTGFTDRAGRNWNLATYVEMATRTGVAQAAVEGHLDQMASLGLHLVLVSDAPMECQRCRPWEGKVLSSTGPDGARTVKVEDSIEDGKMRTVRVAGSVDEAVAAGLLHPNCRHSLSTYLPGLTKQPKATADPEGQKARDTQRDLERRVRKAKTQAAGAIDPAGKAKYDAKAAALQAEIRAHVKENEKYGLRRKPEREAVNLGNRRPAPVVDPAAKRAATRAATRAQFEAVQKARGAADLMAQLDEDAAKGAHVDVLRQHLDYAEQTGSTSPETIAKLRTAVASRDPAQLRKAMDDIAKGHNLTPVGRAGERMKFDPSKHDTLPGVDPYEAGTQVQILRQGHAFRYQGKDITLDRAIVKQATADGGYVERQMTRREYEIAQRESTIDGIQRRMQDGTLDPARRKIHLADIAAQRRELDELRNGRPDAYLDKPAVNPDAKIRTGSPSAGQRGAHAVNITSAADAEVRAHVLDALQVQGDLTPKTMMTLNGVQAPLPGTPEALLFRRTHARAAAYYQRGSRKISMQPEYSGTSVERATVARAQKASHDTGWWTPSQPGWPDGPRATFGHEFGHHIVDTIFLPSATETTNFYSAARGQRLLDEISKRFAVAIPHGGDWPQGTLRGFVSTNQDLVKRMVSTYGASSEHEMLAEIWQEYSALGDQARPHIRAIGKLMQELAEEAAFRP